MNAALAHRARTLASWAGSPWMVVLGIAAGLAVGQAAPAIARGLGFASELYIGLLKMVVLPFMVAGVIFSLRKLLDDKGSAEILPRIAGVFLLGFVAAALGGLAVGLLLGPGRHLSAQTLASMGRLAGTEALGGRHDTVALFAKGVPAQETTAADVIRSIIPSNIFASLDQGDTLKVMAFSLCFGLAAGYGRNGNRPLTDVLESVYRSCLLLTQWFNRLLPAALFAIVASQTAQTGLEPLRAMGRFILALAAASLLLIAASLATIKVASRKPFMDVLGSQREPLLMAMATRASSACMPSLVASLTGRLGFARSRVELLVPLGVSLLRMGQTFYYVMATLFLAQLYDVRLGGSRLAILAASSILTGFASAGTTGVVALSLTGLVSGRLGLPFEAVFALFIAVDPVCDVLRTVVGVAGNAAFAALAAGRPS